MTVNAHALCVIPKGGAPESVSIRDLTIKQPRDCLQDNGSQCCSMQIRRRDVPARDSEAAWEWKPIAEASGGA